MSGTLVNSLSSAPLAGQTLTIGFGTDTCTGLTDALGSATCGFTPQQVPGPYTATASFAGDGQYEASTSVGVPFTLNKEQTQLVNLQPPFFGNGDNVVVSATLTEDDPTPVAGRSVTFTLGTEITAQTCTDPATDVAEANARSSTSTSRSARTRSPRTSPVMRTTCRQQPHEA